MSFSKNDRKRQRADIDYTEPALSTEHEDNLRKSSKRARLDEQRSIFVRSLPPNATSETLADFFSQHYPVKHAVVVADQTTKQSKGYGFVTFADAEDAAEAKTSLDKSQWEGKLIRVEVAERRQRNTTNGHDVAQLRKSEREDQLKPPKLIVRNLPWSIKTSDQLSHLFRSFGKVKFADLPQFKGKLKGFGFVTIRGRRNAKKALEAINGKEIDGRTLAVDYAVDKETWNYQQNQDNDEEAQAEVEHESEDYSGHDDSVDMDNEEKVPHEADGRKNADERLDADLKNFLKNHMQNLEDDTDDDDADADLENKDDGWKRNEGNTRIGGNAAARLQLTDNSSTIFIRNLPFTTTDEQLKSFFAHFGRVRYARIVTDKATDKPAGTGFVCFIEQSDAKACIKEAPRPNTPSIGTKHSILQDENADPGGKYTLDGRLLQIAQAVNKAEASSLAESSLGKRQEKDKRKLFLLSEGFIGRGSPLFDLLTPSEIQMRQASADQRKKLVQKNPTLHISLTRLALRNIPRSFGSKELKELARKAIVEFATDVREGRRQPLSKEENARDGKDAKEKEQQRKLKGKGIVRQAKIVFETKQGSKIPETGGTGRSRGYGFIEYTSHHWALMGLRYLNGQQVKGDDGKNQRLIAEFAIENAQVVQRRRVAEEKASQQQHSRSDTKASGLMDQAAGSGTKPVEIEKLQQKHRRNTEYDHATNRNAVKEDAFKKRLIGRTRLMRKKKANARGKQ